MMTFRSHAAGRPRPDRLTQIVLPTRQSYLDSPPDWRDEVLYFLLVDRFSDGNEANRTPLDRGNVATARPNQSNGQPWRTSHQAKPMREACARARIVPLANFHATRHSYASHCVMNGAALLVVGRNLGHADTKMVERHYGHLAPSFVADQIRAAAPKFGFTPDKKIAALVPR